MAYTRIDGDLEDYNENKQLFKKHISHIEDELEALESADTEIKDSLTELKSDLGGRLVTQTMEAGKTYRFMFYEGQVTNRSSTCIIFARGQRGAQHLSLFVSGYGYNSERVAINELTKGTSMSYTVGNDDFAIDITNNDSSAGASAYIGFFSLAGYIPTISEIE